MIYQIPLIKRDGSVRCYTTVSPQDSVLEDICTWSLSSGGYAVGWIGESPKKMHRVILGLLDGQICDHINRDKLDNRRENLRVCTLSQNAANSTKLRKQNKSGFRGVSWNTRANKWHVRVQRGNKDFIVGHFLCKEEAARAYDAKALELFGEFAVLNFPLASSETFGGIK